MFDNLKLLIKWIFKNIFLYVKLYFKYNFYMCFVFRTMQLENWILNHRYRNNFMSNLNRTE